MAMSYLDGVLPLGEVDLLLALLLRLEGGLVLGESAAEGTGEAGSEVKRSVLLVLVEQTELGALVGVDDGENASDRLANVVAVEPQQISIPVPKYNFSYCAICDCVGPNSPNVSFPLFLR